MEITQIVNRKIIGKINNTLNWLFENIYKIEKLLARLTKPEIMIELVESGKKWKTSLTDVTEIKKNRRSRD